MVLWRTKEWRKWDKERRASPAVGREREADVSQEKEGEEKVETEEKHAQLKQLFFSRKWESARGTCCGWTVPRTEAGNKSGCGFIKLQRTAGIRRPSTGVEEKTRRRCLRRERERVA